jgi:hypothetical protein
VSARKRKARTPDTAAAPVRPTPQTVRKLRRDLVAHLYGKGRLRREHVDAAEEIRFVWYAFSRRLGPSAVNLLAVPAGNRSGQARQPIEWLTDREEIVWRNRYRPWAGEMARIHAGGIVTVSRLQMMVDLLVDNQGLRRVEAWYRLRHGAAFENLRDGLHRYAEIAGWTEPEKKFTVNDKNNFRNVDMGQNIT